MPEHLSRSGAWKRAHPERAAEYNRRSNAKRPGRDRADYEPCARCGKPKAARKKSGLCRACWIETGAASEMARRREEARRARRSESETAASYFADYCRACWLQLPNSTRPDGDPPEGARCKECGQPAILRAEVWAPR